MAIFVNFDCAGDEIKNLQLLKVQVSCNLTYIIVLYS